MLFDLADHEPQKISRRHLYQYTRNRELVSLTTERTDGSATRDREVGPRKSLTLQRARPCTWYSTVYVTLRGSRDREAGVHATHTTPARGGTAGHIGHLSAQLPYSAHSHG